MHDCISHVLIAFLLSSKIAVKLQEFSFEKLKTISKLSFGIKYHWFEFILFKIWNILMCANLTRNLFRHVD